MSRLATLAIHTKSFSWDLYTPRQDFNWVAIDQRFAFTVLATYYKAISSRTQDLNFATCADLQLHVRGFLEHTILIIYIQAEEMEHPVLLLCDISRPSVIE